MQLTKTHRSALLVKLDIAKQEIETAKQCMIKSREDDSLYFEIDHFLAIERVRIITEALTENEIDY